jgi:hypothetical protein
MNKEDETWEKNVPFVDGHGIKIPSYTYWNIAYALTLKGNFSIHEFLYNKNFESNLFIGVEKLLEQDPLKKLIPVDELCPIMFDKHPK